MGYFWKDMEETENTGGLQGGRQWKAGGQWYALCLTHPKGVNILSVQRGDMNQSERIHY